MEFACKVAGSKLVLVLGHTKCGALKGGLDAAAVNTLGLANLSKLVLHFDPCIEEIMEEREERSSKNESLLNRLTVKNILKTKEDIRQNSPILNKMEQDGEIIIAGANYDVETGEVRWI